MEAVKAAVRRFDQNPKTHKKGKEVDDAVAQLSSTIRLFELSAASTNTFIRLSELLRGRLQPLYRIYPALALDYAVSVLRFIHNDKILLNLDNNLAASWERLVVSLLSGILDYLEEHSNQKSRRSVATAFQPVLCTLYFSEDAALLNSYNGEILSNAYQLLLATLDSPGAAPSELREEIGSKRFGFTISAIKDFLALESILDLFGSIIPPLKDGKERRSTFLAEVFDATVFENSHHIVECLNTITSSDWGVTSAKIVNLLAASDISFPQPFQISDLKAGGQFLIASAAFFVDKLEFLVNLDQEGKIETFHVPFTTVQSLSISRSSLSEATVTLEISEGPLLGNQRTSMPEEDRTISWNIKNTRLDAFKKAVKHRKVKVELHAQRKLSVISGFSLEFDSTKLKESSQALQAERVEKLWVNSPTRPGVMQPTSPLLPPSTKRDVVKDSQHAQPDSDDLPETVFLDPKGNLSLGPPARQPADDIEVISSSNDPPPSPQRHVDQQATVERVAESEDELVRPISRATKTRKRNIVASDEEEDESSLPKNRHAPQTKPATNIAPHIQPQTRATRKRAKRMESVDPVINVDATSSPKPKAPTTVAGAKQRPVRHASRVAQAKAAPDESRIQHNSKEQDTKPSKKRAVQEVIEEEPPPKRARVEATNISPVVSFKPDPIKKYGRRGRASSPVTVPSGDAYFDSPPKEPPRTRARAMKGKNGKATPKPAPKPKPKPALVKKKDPDATIPDVVKQPITDKVQRQSKSGADDTLVDLSNAEKKAEKQGKVQFVQESAVQPSNKQKQTTTGKENTLNKKPSKAPWQRDSLQRTETAKDVISISDSPEPAPKQIEEKTSDPVSVIDDDPSHTFVVDDLPSFEPNLDYVEYEESIKGASSTSATSAPPSPPRPEVVPELPDVVMIDLTLSPDVPRRRNAPEVSKHPARESHSIEMNSRRNDQHSRQTEERHASIPGKRSTARTTTRPERKVERMPSPPPLIKNEAEITHSTPRPKAQKAEPAPEPFDRMPSPLLEKPKAVEDSHSPPRQRAPATRPVSRMPSPPPRRASLRLDEAILSLPRVTPPPRNTPTPSRKRKEGYSRRHIPEPTRNERHGAEEDNHFDDKHERAARGAGEKKEHRRHAKMEAEPNDKIVDILNKINEALIEKVERRFTSVSEDLHRGQQIILQGAAETLQEMYEESIRHYNSLYDLQEEYAVQRVKIQDAVAVFRNASTAVAQATKDVVIDQSRRSLTKKFPKSLISNSKALDILSDPTIKF